MKITTKEQLILDICQYHLWLGWLDRDTYGLYETHLKTLDDYFLGEIRDIVKKIWLKTLETGGSKN